MKTITDLTVLMNEATTHLRERALRVCTAESCTGGLLAQMLTALPGSSAWFECGWVTYSDVTKNQLLQVPSSVLITYGAVSEKTAIAMAHGALEFSRADLAIAITGIAGPAGGSTHKPVGMVWLALQLRNKNVITRCEYFSGDRESVRTQAAACALQMILQIDQK